MGMVRSQKIGIGSIVWTGGERKRRKKAPKKEGGEEGGTGQRKQIAVRPGRRLGGLVFGSRKGLKNVDWPEGEKNPNNRKIQKRPW